MKCRPRVGPRAWHPEVARDFGWQDDRVSHRAKTKHGGGLRWRDRPRRSFWALDRSYLFFVVLLGYAWVGFAVFGWAALTGRLADQPEALSRWLDALLALAFLAPSLGLTWVLVRFLRRPVLGSKGQPDAANH